MAFLGLLGVESIKKEIQKPLCHKKEKKTLFKSYCSLKHLMSIETHNKNTFTKFGLINARSIRNKVDEIRSYSVDFDLDVCIVTEMWLKPNSVFEVNIVVPEGYNIIIHHFDRAESCGGGVAVISKLSYK